MLAADGASRDIGPTREPCLLIGIVSDIHCNVAGLRRALQLLDGVDEILCLGDSIYEFRFSNDVVSLLRERNVITIGGNHEHVFFGPHGVRALAAEWIDREHAQWLEQQPHERLLRRDHLNIRMIHSTPWEPRGEYVFPQSPMFARMAECDADVLLYGHTHHAIATRLGGTLIVNPGSAGDARGTGENALLSCAILDTETTEARILRFSDAG